MIATPEQDVPADAGGEPDPGAPSYAIACGPCEKNEQPITQDAVVAFLHEHAACREAATKFKVEVPKAMTASDSARFGVHEVWALQARSEGYRPISRVEFIGEDDDTRRDVTVVGWVVPGEWRVWRGEVHGYVDPTEDETVAKAVRRRKGEPEPEPDVAPEPIVVPGDPIPGDVAEKDGNVVWPEGGEPE